MARARVRAAPLRASCAPAHALWQIISPGAGRSPLVALCGLRRRGRVTAGGGVIVRAGAAQRRPRLGLGRLEIGFYIRGETGKG